MTQPYCKLEPGDVWQPGDGFFTGAGAFELVGDHLHGKPYTVRPDVGPYFRPVPLLVSALLQFARTVDVSTIRPGKKTEAKWIACLDAADHAFAQANITR